MKKKNKTLLAKNCYGNSIHWGQFPLLLNVLNYKIEGTALYFLSILSNYDRLKIAYEQIDFITRIGGKCGRAKKKELHISVKIECASSFKDPSLNATSSTGMFASTQKYWNRVVSIYSDFVPLVRSPVRLHETECLVFRC